MAENKDLNIINTLIKIPGVRKKTTIIQITDLHLLQYNEHDREDIKTFGQEHSDWTPNAEKILYNVLKYCNQTKPDIIVFTGDILGFPSTRNISILKEYLQSLSCSFMYVFGNHERALVTSDLTQSAQKYFTNLYSFAFSNDIDIQVKEINGVRLIGIDDSDNQISKAQLKKLIPLLYSNIPSVIFMHIPIYLPALFDDVMNAWKQPFVIGTPLNILEKISAFDYLVPTPDTIEFTDIITKQDTSIEAIFTGHEHYFNRADYFYKNRLQFITPMAHLKNGKGIVRKIILTE